MGKNCVCRKMWNQTNRTELILILTVVVAFSGVPPHVSVYVFAAFWRKNHLSMSNSLKLFDVLQFREFLVFDLIFVFTRLDLTSFSEVGNFWTFLVLTRLDLTSFSKIGNFWTLLVLTRLDLTSFSKILKTQWDIMNLFKLCFFTALFHEFFG